VRVVSVPGWSQELCGGTHCAATGDIGFFSITDEGGIAAGVRRIEAVTGAEAVARYQEERRQVTQVLELLNVPLAQAAEAVGRLQADVKQHRRDLEKLAVERALGAGGGEPDVSEVGGVKVLTHRRADLGREHLRSLADAHKARVGSGVVVVASEAEGKVSVIVAVTPDLTSRLSAARLIKAIAPVVGGGGGGRADFAEAGGRHPERLDEMFVKARQAVGADLGLAGG